MKHTPHMRTIYQCVLVFLAIFTAVSTRAQTSTTNPALHGPTISHQGRTLIHPRTMATHTPLDQSRVLRPTTQINKITDLGYDIVYTFDNTTHQDMPLGRLVVGTITLGENIRYLNVLRGTRLPSAHWDTYIGQAWAYPLNAYSPVSAIMNDDYAIGVSLLYPIETYKHDALVRVGRAGGIFKGPKESRGWFIAFDLSDDKHTNQYTKLDRPAMLPPGESRSYTVAVRVIKRAGTWTNDPTGEQDWLETLLPYRQYFQSRFGPVEYTRNDRPVHALEAANVGAQSVRNPRGFFGDRSSRPDLAGFGTLARKLTKPNGFDRVMLWAPSGIYPSHLRINFPNMFTLGWKDLPLLHSTAHLFRQVPRSGKQLGFWWGRAAEYTDSWDAHTLTALDLSDTEHLADVAQKLTLAKDAGATLVGLDNFIHEHMPIWDQVRYLRAIRKIYPELKLIAEPMCCDIIHSVTPSFVAAYRSPKDGIAESDFHKIRAPNYLADFMLPGHESWAFFRYPEIVRASGAHITAARTQRDIARLADFGYVPTIVTSYQLTNPEASRAKKTWLTTVPKHLRQPEHAP